MGLMSMNDSSSTGSSTTQPDNSQLVTTPDVPQNLDPSAAVPAPVIPGLDVQPPSGLADSDPNASPVKNMTDFIDNFAFVKNPALDRMAFDVDQYAQSVKSVQGYMQGHRVEVTYFRSNGRSIATRSNSVDITNGRHGVHTSLTRIDKCELTLTAPWQFVYNQSDTRTNVTGNAYCYPEMDPRLNDLFLASVGDNKVGIFRITAVTPGSWRSSTAYEITFYLQSFMTYEDLKFFQAVTDEVMVFDKTNALGNTTALLSEDRYLALKQMQDLRVVLAKYFFRKFYNRAIGSFFRPDNGIYDPYLVKFVTNMAEYNVVKFRPRQLYAQVEFSYWKTIWSRLLEPENTSIEDVYPYFRTNTYVGHTQDVGFTNIANRPYLYVDTPDNEPGQPLSLFFSNYVFSIAFYTGDVDHMTPFEIVLYNAIATRQNTDFNTLINTYLVNYQKLSDLDQFYLIPVYLWLIDVTTDCITRIMPG